MKNMSQWIGIPLILMCFICPNFLISDDRYQDEINAIRLRTAQLIEHGRKRINQIAEFKNAWEEVSIYGAELSQLNDIRMNPTCYSQGDADLLALHELTFEKVFVDAIEKRLGILMTKAEECFHLADGIASECPDLKISHESLKNEILKEFSELSENIKNRKQQIDSNLKIWREWEMEVAFQAELQQQSMIENRLQVVNDIGQVKGIFNRLWLNYLSELYEGDFPRSQQILQGYSWFQSLIPFYFADKIATQSQADYLKEVLDEAELKKQDMTAQYLLKTGLRSRKIFALEEGDRDAGDACIPEPSDSFPKDSSGLGDFSTKMDAGSCREYKTERCEGNMVIIADVKIKKDVCKYDDAGNGSAEVTVEGSGFVSIGPNNKCNEKVNVPASAELQRTIDSTLSRTIHNSFSVPCDPKIVKEDQDFKNNLDKLNRMVKEAHEKTTDTADKEGLEKVKNELANFQVLKDRLEATVHDKANDIKQVQQRAQTQILGIAASLPTPPNIRKPPATSKSVALNQLEKIRSSIRNFAVASGKIISKALSNFIGSLANSTTGTFQQSAKEVLRATQERGHPSKSIAKPEFIAMTKSTRESILNKAKSLRDGTIVIKYSQKPLERLGPDAYDCSGFVSTMYAEAGLPFGHPNVQGIIDGISVGPFKEVSIKEAQPGDIVVWKKGEGKNPHNHVAIFNGIQNIPGKGKDLAVISTSDTRSEKGLNTIADILIKHVMGDPNHPVVHIYQWKKQELF